VNVLDLFSGIGGFSLGLERAGMRTVAFCEIDPYCRRVLARHWPDVPVFGDVRELTAARLMADTGYTCGSSRRPREKREPSEIGERQATEHRPCRGNMAIDVICGGFPCQDISTAGKGAGIGGARSGLWGEYARIIGEVRPAYVIVENVAALLGRGLERVLGDLAALGYDAEWHCIPASAIGAPHRRDRLWIVAYPGCEQRQPIGGECISEDGGWPSIGPRNGCSFMADAQGHGCDSIQYSAHYPEISEGIRWGDAAGQWRIEPDVGRVAHGVPSRVDRLRGLGNAVVPQIPEIIGRAIMSMEATT